MEIDSHQSLLVLNLDLNDSTLKLPIFEYVKPKGPPGTAFLRLAFGKNGIEKIDGLQVSAKDLTLKGDIFFDKTATLKRILLRDAQVGPSRFNGNILHQNHWTLNLRVHTYSCPIVNFYRNAPKCQNLNKLRNPHP